MPPFKAGVVDKTMPGELAKLAVISRHTESNKPRWKGAGPFVIINSIALSTSLVQFSAQKTLTRRDKSTDSLAFIVKSSEVAFDLLTYENCARA